MFNWRFKEDGYFKILEFFCFPEKSTGVSDFLVVRNKTFPIAIVHQNVVDFFDEKFYVF